MPIRCRAVSDSQKALRREQILDAAASMFDSAAYESVLLKDIAQVVGITKAALYRYFRSKEALFLALYQRELESLLLVVLAVEKDLTTANVEDRLALLYTTALVRSPRFCKLAAILHGVLEPSLSYEEAVEFKRYLLQESVKFSTWLAQHFELGATDPIKLMAHIQEALIGCWYASNPPQIIHEAIDKNPELAVFNRSFSESLLHHISALVYLEFKGR